MSGRFQRFWRLDSRDPSEWRQCAKQIGYAYDRYARVNSCPAPKLNEEDEYTPSAAKNLNHPEDPLILSVKRMRSVSENDLRQQKEKFHSQSCPSLAFEFESPITLQQDNVDILSSFRSKQFAILFGSSSSLLSIGLQNLVKRYTDISPNDDGNIAWNIIEPHFSKGPPRIRLEVVFEIFQQYVDPHLSLLDDLTADTLTTDRSHDILAMLALTSTIVTTNFDHLIEDTGRFHLGKDENVVPFDVFCTEEHFQSAYELITDDRSSDLTGLWKLHGTVAVWKNNEQVLVRADEDGGPIATLKRLSLTRESTERRVFLQHLLETRPLIILNYSGTDDFDVTRWLKTVSKPLNVLWIQHIADAIEPSFWSGIEIAQGLPESIASFDRALIAMASAWHERGIADRLTVATTSDAIEFLLQLIPLDPLPKINPVSRTESHEEYPLSTPTPWQSSIVSGAMLSHLSYFSEAKKYFDHAATKSRKGLREYCIAKLAAAEASIEIGDRNGRIQAMQDAIDTAKTSPLPLQKWAHRKSKFIGATVKRFVERDGQAIAIAELQELLDKCGKPEDHIAGREKNVAHDAAISLAQLRRFLPASPEPSDIARQWIESIPKSGLLQTKALNLHETALNRYQLAKNVGDVDSAIQIMKEAIEIREELGHMRGLVASLNVLGSMQMRRADWSEPLASIYIQRSAEQFRRSIEYSDKHASVFDQFQARIHLTICLLRYSNRFDTKEELAELCNYFQTRTTDDLRTQIESEFCLAMRVFISNENTFDQASKLFEDLADKYTSYNDARLIRILAAARFNSELCQDWQKGQVHTPNPDLTKDIVTRKLSIDSNAYWSMRIERAEKVFPKNAYEQLELLLDPLSP